MSHGNGLDTEPLRNYLKRKKTLASIKLARKKKTLMLTILCD